MSNRFTPQDIIEKKNSSKVVAMTCYSARIAIILDRHTDILLVGDSLGMVLYGHPNTLSVTEQMMQEHGKAVVNNSKKSLIAIDLPFGTYESGSDLAFKTASKLFEKTGATGVKLEGGKSMIKTVEYLVKKGIPVIGHIGLMPQKYKNASDFKSKGHSIKEQKDILNDALLLEEAGVFSIVIEAVKESLAKKITNEVNIPTIGIGAGRFCDGQILVTDDMLGMYEDFSPKFVKKFANLFDIIDKATSMYSSEVRNGKFPNLSNIYK